MLRYIKNSLKVKIIVYELMTFFMIFIEGIWIILIRKVQTQLIISISVDKNDQCIKHLIYDYWDWNQYIWAFLVISLLFSYFIQSSYAW